VSDHLVARGRFLDFIDRKGWEFVARRDVDGIVLIVPLTDDGSIVLIEQLRPPVARNVVELPAGLSGDDEGGRDEPLEVSARRELLEETGFEAETMEFLADGPPSPGVTSEIVSYFLARGLVKRHRGGGVGGERIVVHEVPLENAHDWLLQRSRDGTLVDAKVWAGLYFALRPPPRPSTAG
jgi:ADP-ribose pyrophosphatase